MSELCEASEKPWCLSATSHLGLTTVYVQIAKDLLPLTSSSSPPECMCPGLGAGLPDYP